MGGTARYVGELVEKIPNSVLATGYVQGSELEDASIETLSPFRIPHMGRKLSLRNDIKSWLEIRKLVQELKPQIVHTHTFKAGLLGRLIGGNFKRIHTFHGHLFEDSSFSKLEKFLILHAERFLAKKTDVLISVGKKVGSDLRTTGVGSGSVWHSIPPGIDKLSEIDKLSARAILGLEPRGLLIGWLARMTKVKNPLLLLEVAKQLSDISFVMAGEGDLFEVVKMSSPNNVSVIGWSDASTFWSAVDCAVSTSENEGMPIALIEAQMAGVPAVATNVGSSPEVVLDGITGLVVGMDVNSIVSALRTLIRDDQMRADMSIKAITHGRNTFSLQEMLDHHSSVYEELLTN